MQKDRNDHIEVVGQVIESNSGIFKVKIDTSTGDPQFITARPSGKIRKNKINVVVGDKVQIALSPYDLTNGMIKRRL